ncbi:putative G-protein coupled receptor 156 [Arapaima gigas]
MDLALNCSLECPGPRNCFLHPGIDNQEAWEVLHRLCSLALVNQVSSRPPSPVLSATVGVMLSGGILLALFFLAFTLRCRNNRYGQICTSVTHIHSAGCLSGLLNYSLSNRIVKMSSPNLNVLSLCGSVLTYCSGLLFATEESSLLPHTHPATLLQVRIWTLCIGSSLVFGPILCKSWRLYRIFMQRVPNKRVIIRDIQLIGLVALLILVDILVLTTWGLTDPVQCARSIIAVVKVAEEDASYSLSQMDSCSSLYSPVWIFLLSVFKGALLLYGAYLAGLTSNVSSPPVNQSPTIMAAVCLVCLSMAGVVLVSGLLPAWTSMVHGVISGAIFLCTLTTNCLLFVPQLNHWKQFEGEQKPNSSQMAKFFSSPSKSLCSIYSEEGLYYLLEENISMKRLLAEKDAVIASLQEQVNNAKDKLLRLMSASPHPGVFEVPYNPSLSSTQSAELANSSSPSLSSITGALPTPFSTITVNAAAQRSPSSSLKSDSTDGMAKTMYDNMDIKGDSEKLGCVTEPSLQSISHGSSTCTQTLASSQQREVVFREPGSEQAFVSSEQLQEVLQELSMDAVSSLHSESSSSIPVISRYHSISPYVMRKRRPPFRASMRGSFTSHCLGSQHTSQPLGVSVMHLDSPFCASEMNRKLRSSRCQPCDLNPRQNRGREGEGDEIEAKPKQGFLGVKENICRAPDRSGFPLQLPRSQTMGRPNKTEGPQQVPWEDSGSESSSSEEGCCYHRPYCRACISGSFESVETSASETDSESMCRYRPHSFVSFKENIRPTFV